MCSSVGVMASFSVKNLSTIGGIATVSMLHSFIPTHWLPFSIVGRAQKWTLARTLLVSTFPFLPLYKCYFCVFSTHYSSCRLVCNMICSDLRHPHGVKNERVEGGEMFFFPIKMINWPWNKRNRAEGASGCFNRILA